MTKTLSAVALAVLVIITVAGTTAAAPPVRRPEKVVIVAISGITFEDLSSGAAPNLRAFARRWPVAAMSVRTVGPRTDEASAFATLGAGNRARGLGRDNVEFVPSTTRSTAGLIVLHMDGVRSDNTGRLHYGAVPGTLGTVLHQAGFRTGVVGNSDGGAVPMEGPTRRPRGTEERRFAGLALADHAGKIDAGDTGAGLVVADKSTANGYRTNPGRLVSAFRQTLEDADVVLVELADTYREGLVLYAEISGEGPPLPDEFAPERLAAISRDDRAFAGIVGQMNLERDALMVLGMTGPGPALRERLTVAIAGGAGFAPGGWLTSATTNRDGLITLADAGPGIVALLGLQAPDAMTGQPLRSVASSETGRLERLLEVQAAALFHLRWLTPFFGALVLLQALLYLLAWRPAVRAPGRGAPALRAATLGFLAVPVATVMWQAFRPHELGIWALPLLLGLCAVCAALSLAGPWRRYPSGPPAFVCAITFAVIAADLLTGSGLQMSGLIGYSPIVAGRFFGIGNLDFAVFGTSAVLGASAAIAFFPRRAILIVAAAALVAAVINGAPWLGADFGGLVSLVVGFGVLLILLSGRRLSVGRLALLGTAALLIGLAAGFADHLRPPEVQTHLGRFVGRLIEQGPGAVIEILLRKAAANWSVATNSILSLSVPIAGIFLYLLLRRPRGRLRTALANEPGLAPGLAAAAALNLTGFAVNDSGIAVPAMGLAVAVPYCLATILAMTSDAPSRLIGDEAAGD